PVRRIRLVAQAVRFVRSRAPRAARVPRPMKILAAFLILASQGPRNLLTGSLSEQTLAAALLPAAQWHPYPTIRDRADWEAVPQEIRAAFIQAARQHVGTTWERIPATVTLQFIRNGNRSNYDAINTRQREKLATLVLAEVFENGGRFLDDIWWMGFGERKTLNTWTPWIDSNWLAAVLLLEADPRRRAAAVYKIMRSLDNFINIYPDDGASDEGPGYWDRAAASLFDNLELLRGATSGRVDIYGSPLVR